MRPHHSESLPASAPADIAAGPGRALLLPVLLLAATPFVAPAQTWNDVSGPGPTPRREHAMVYDGQRDRTVMFGGDDYPVFFGLGDTWEWDGGAWTSAGNLVSARRSGHALAYDGQRARVLMFGGGIFTAGLFGDTWAWDGAVWTQLTTAGPSPRTRVAMAYDSQRDRAVLFGGEGSGGRLGDTWEWDGTAWSPVAFAGPLARSRHAMVYDSWRGRTVLFGGMNATLTALRDTWEWDGSVWTQILFAGPSARYSHALAFDGDRGRTLLFGGRGNTGWPTDTWEWDGMAWSPIAVTGPAARADHAMAYDGRRRRTVLFGGHDGSNNEFSDTWEFAAGANFSTFGDGCRGSANVGYVCGERNPSGGVLVGTLSPVEFAIGLPVALVEIVGFEMFTQSTGGVAVIPAHIYRDLSSPPVASTTMTVGPTPGFYTATFSTPVQVSPVFIAIDLSAQTVFLPDLLLAAPSAVQVRPNGSGPWTTSSSNRPAWRVHCVDVLTPTLGNVGDPILGAAYDVTLDDALPAVGAISVTGLSDTVFGGTALPAPLPDAPGCLLWVAPDATRLLSTSTNGTAVDSFAVPNAASYIGLELFHQWVVFDPANPLGLVVSNAGRAWLGR
ncbi:MAG: hypothetical protein KDE27_06105 [Planctomycetes bacterium]|nr:hypothetical protein [Planctomycetota bacterium]